MVAITDGVSGCGIIKLATSERSSIVAAVVAHIISTVSDAANKRNQFQAAT
jgi:hypothetical protein